MKNINVRIINLRVPMCVLSYAILEIILIKVIPNENKINVYDFNSKSSYMF